MKGEKWKPVVGFRGYEVSDMGRVRSLPRAGADGRFLHGKMLSQNPTKADKRLRICLYRSGERFYKLAYHLVLEAFIGPCPMYHEARHYPDRSLKNNRLSNLSWATHEVNARDMIEHGTVNPNRLADGKFWRKAS